MLQTQQDNSNHVTAIATAAIAIIVSATLLWPGLAQNLLTASGFIPHGHCYLWQPNLVWLHISTDLLIGICYVAISVTLSYLVYRTRRQIPFHWMFLVFGAFIVACGATHFMEVWTLWHPTYWLSGDVKLITAIASVSAAVALPPLVPKIEGLLETVKLAEERREQLEAARQNNDNQTWLKTSVADLSRSLQGQQTLNSAAQIVMSRLAALVGAQQGVLYWVEDGDTPHLRLLGGYAYEENEAIKPQLRLGEGIIGQCAIEKQQVIFNDLPSDYVRIRSGLGSASPQQLIVMPILLENRVVSVLEFALLHPLSELFLALLTEASEMLGVVLTSIAATARTNELLVRSQALAEELQQQQAELQDSNRRLEEKADELQATEAQLREQQEELRQSNEQLQFLNTELEEKAQLLEERNTELEQARQSLEEKASQLALSSQYKSEFLANMSHELRTPLNSLLILARLLSENQDGNLTAKQVEYSRTIYTSGADLLELINDILDLAKIESGNLSIEPHLTSLADLQTSLELTFEQIAIEQGITFTIERDDNLPASFLTDSKRLQQILKNLLSNAFKFTEQGQVSLRISPVSNSVDREPMIAFSVRDTGIGIPPEKQQLIFEAFQQADGTTSRRYGGTGLGLSISRELTQLLNGRLELTSQVGTGSTFTLYLPCRFPAEPRQTAISIERHSDAISSGDRDPIAPSLIPAADTALYDGHGVLKTEDILALRNVDRVVLIIEDDLAFARSVLEVAQAQGFRGIIAVRGGAGIAIAQQLQPNAILLDLRLPDSSGWGVLDQLKHHPLTRRIPVYTLSGDENLQRSLQHGAIAYLQKPATLEALTGTFTSLNQWLDQRIKALLIIEDDATQAQSIAELLAVRNVQTTIAATGKDAIARLESQSFDGVVLDLMLPDISGVDLLETIKQRSHWSTLPIVVYTAKELTPVEETRLRRLAETIILKDGSADFDSIRCAPERLLSEITLFLHQIQAQSAPLPERLLHPDNVLSGKKVLIVDDDIRNVFAVTSLLEEHNVEVIYAVNGEAGLQMLSEHPDINLVLMDIMMPEMDGYEATRRIRQQPVLRSLPIIALTAKAMQGDREKCLEAGTSDYITKPVNPEQLLSLLRVWLYPANS